MVCEVYEKAKRVLNLLKWEKGRVSLKEILETLMKEVQTTEISPGMDVREWLENMVLEGLVRKEEIDGETYYIF